MRRLLLVALAVLLLLTAVSCDRGEEQNVFLLEKGGYSDPETGVHYQPLSPAFEPMKSAALRGVALDDNDEVLREFLEIPELDSALWLCDDMMTVWYAGETAPDPATLTPRSLLVCEETSYSQERARFVAGEDDATIAQILTLWHTGEGTEEPTGELSFSRRLKLISAELTNIYYCFDFCVWDEQGYFYDRMAGRIVAVPVALCEMLMTH